MSAPEFRTRESLARFGLKGPAAAQWLATCGIVVPAGAVVGKVGSVGAPTAVAVVAGSAAA